MKIEVEENLFNSLDLKKELKYPDLFFKPDPDTVPYDMKGYRFFIPKNYKVHPTKESQANDKNDDS